MPSGLLSLLATMRSQAKVEAVLALVAEGVSRPSTRSSGRRDSDSRGFAAGCAGDVGAVTEQPTTSPDSQAARGLTPDEQRAERERESRESDETKFQEAVDEDREIR